MKIKFYADVSYFLFSTLLGKLKWQNKKKNKYQQQKESFKNNWKHLLATQFLIVCFENLSKQFDLHSFHVHIEISFYSVN